MDIKEKYIRRGIRTASVTCKDETFVILLSKKGNPTLFKLTQDGVLIWRLLEENRKVKEIVSAIAKIKKISSGYIEHQLVTYIDKLAKNHIVDIIDSPVKEYY